MLYAIRWARRTSYCMVQNFNRITPSFQVEKNYHPICIATVMDNGAVARPQVYMMYTSVERTEFEEIGGAMKSYKLPVLVVRRVCLSKASRLDFSLRVSAVRG